MRYSLVLAACVSLAARPAAAQVLLTEVMPDPADDASDVGEWIELENLGPDVVSLAGWTLNDYVGTSSAAESTTRWTFPATASIAPDQVLLVARQATAFIAESGFAPDWELEDGALDEPATANLIPAGGASSIQLSNSSAGDGVVLRDLGGAIVDAIEWGTDRSVPGSPLMAAPDEGESIVRVARDGESALDFVPNAMPSPGMGYVPAMGPVLATARPTPAHLAYGDTLSILATARDTDGLREVALHLTIATASVGPAAQDYLSVALTATTTPLGDVYRFSAPVGELEGGLSFPDPPTFHDRYVRYYVSAEDALGTASVDPAGADESARSTVYHQANVMPSEPSPIGQVREQDLGFRARWLRHSARVRGVVLVKSGLLGPEVAVEDASGLGIRAVNAPALALEPGDRVEVSGEIAQLHGLMQLGGDAVEVRALGDRAPVTTTTVTIAGLVDGAEYLESRLVHVEDAELAVPSARWPGEGGGLVRIKDTTGEIDVWIAPGSPLDGADAPEFGFHLTGLVAQMTPAEDGTRDGYRIVPRGPEDVTAKPRPKPPVDEDVPDAGVEPSLEDPATDAGDGAPPAVAGTPVDDGGCGCSASSADPALGGLSAFISIMGLVIIRVRRRR